MEQIVHGVHAVQKLTQPGGRLLAARWIQEQFTQIGRAFP
jgi:hypothetical protein